MEKALTPPSSRQSGFTLIEVMVALIVLVLGVLGAAAMTLTAVRDTKQSALRSQASAFAYEISDLMRANRDAPGGEGNFTGAQPSGAVSNCWTTGCTLDQMAANDYYEWLQKLVNPIAGLPSGLAKICHDKTQLASFASCDNDVTAPLVVKIQWTEKNNVARGQATVGGAVTVQMVAITIQPFL